MVFFSNSDFQYYRENLILSMHEFGCKIYAYCLKTNHVHLIVDPGDNPESLPLLMKRVSGRQMRYVNKLKKRSGSLWEGRFHSSIVSTEENLLSCSRYVELSPMRAGMVESPSNYPWSSFGIKSKGVPDEVVDFDSVYEAIRDTSKECQKAYQAYVLETIPDEELKLIRDFVQRNQVTGGSKYREQQEKKYKIRLSGRGPGRPKKAGK